MDNLSGKRVKGYHLQHLLGEGGFGTVYRAQQTSVGRDVAIKIIRPKFANQPDFIRRFETEAQTIARLEHMHIVPLHDYWRDPEGAYLVMRLLRGGSLRDTLKKEGALSVETAALMLQQIATALDTAHNRHIIHRDLKPENILLDEDGNAYLADFGIAKDLNLAAGPTAAEEIVGSLDYISPEQARSQPVTPRTDVYSLGVVLYEMLTGSHPWPDLSSVERLYKHINDPLPEISDLHGTDVLAVNAVIQKATAKNPENRYTTPIDLAAAFQEAVAADDALSSSLEAQLTRREQDILQGLIEGRSNKEIASDLFVEVTTVKWYIRQIFRKLGVRSRVQAVIKARELHLITDLTDEPAAVISASALAAVENPYKGLQAFTAADALDFFGREKLVEKLVNRLRTNRFLAVVGPSGSGKSSVVKAGLIPALWRGDLPGSDDWYVVDLLPGSRPIDQLEVALTRVAADQSANMGAHLSRDANGLLRCADLILPDDGSEVVVVIDQFEEVFTLVENEDERQHFLDLLCAAVSDPRSRVRVVVTLRADFYDRPLRYRAFGALLRGNMETILPLSPDELERAIVEPAKRVYVTFEPGVVATIVGEMTYQAGALPLLQYALTELFDRREGRQITQAAYAEIGGAVGALARRAEATYLEMDAAGQDATQQLFLRLVTLGEGVEDTRRRTPRAELLAISEDVERMEEIIDTFAAYRLLSLDHDADSRTPTVEVAHEAILREWERLRGWLNESREDIRQERLIAQTADAWQENHRDTSYLLTGTRLEQAETWREVTQLAMTPLEREYIRASVQEAKVQEHAEAQRQAREQAQEKRSRNLLRALVAVFGAAAAVAAVLALYGWSQNQLLNTAVERVEKERDRAKVAEQEALRQASIGLAAQAVAELESNTPERGVLLALEALENYPYTPQAESALAQTVSATRPYTNLFSGTVEAVSFSNDGRLVAATAFHDALLWNPDSGETQTIGKSYLDPLTRPAYVDIDWDAAGNQIVTVTASFATMTAEAGTIKIWDMTTQQLLHSWIGHDGEDIWAVDWSNNADFLATGGADNRVRLWDAVSFEETQVFSGHSDTVFDAALAPDDGRLATASADKTVRIWNVMTGELLQTLSGHFGTVQAVNWSPDGTQIISAGADGLVVIWNADTGNVMNTFAHHSDAVLAAEWSPDGTLIATASEDGTTLVWEAASSSIIARFVGSSRTLAWSTDGSTLVVGFGVSGLRAWNMSDHPLRLTGHESNVLDAHWTPDGSHIVTGGFDGTARVWDVATGENTLVYRNHILEGGPTVAGEIHISSDSQWVVTHGGDNNTRVWNIETGEDRFVFPIFGGNVFSPDGSKLLIFAWDQALVIDWASGETLLEFDPELDEFCFFARLSWSPAGNYVSTPCPDMGRVDIWDVQTGAHVRTVTTHDGTVNSTAFSRDGTQLLTTDDTGIVHIWDASTGERQLDFQGHTAAVWDAEWSPNGQRIASADETGSVRIWDANTGQQVYQTSVAFSPININWSLDGSHLIVVGFGSSIPAIIPVWQSTQELIAHAKACCVWRELSTEERAQFGLPEQ